MPFLAVVQHGWVIQTHELKHEIILGRNDNCDLVLHNPNVSRKHLKFTVDPSGMSVEDLDSFNGARLNGTPIGTKCRIQIGDRISVPGTEIVVSHSPIDAAASLPVMESVEIADAACAGKQLAEDELSKLFCMIGKLTDARGNLQLIDTISCGVLAVFPKTHRGQIIKVKPAGQLHVLNDFSPGQPADHDRVLCKSIVEYAIRSKKAVISMDAKHDGRFSASNSVANLQVRSVMCAPLIAGETALGAIYVDLYDGGNQFTRRDLETLATIASLSAKCFHNTLLTESLQDAHDELEKRVHSRTLELREANVKLEQSLAARDRYLAMLSHELRNPLAAISSAVQLLKRDCDEQTADQALSVAVHQSDHMSRLLADLLDATRITTGKLSMKRQIVDLRDILEESITVAQANGIATQRDIITATDAELIVVGDPVRLQQLLTNVLINAMKYSSEGDSIWVNAYCEADRAIIRIRDQGVGMHPEHAAHAFDLFYQSDATLDRAEGGMGIGLTLAKQIALLHDGEIHAESDGPGCGSTISLSLPVYRKVSATRSLSGEPQSVAGFEKKRIAVVEDNPDTCLMLETLLNLEGHEVHTANDGRKGIELILKIKPDLAFVDIGLPEMTGHEIAAELSDWEERQQMLLVALTGYDVESDLGHWGSNAFDHRLIKPASIESILSLISEHSLNSMRHKTH